MEAGWAVTWVAEGPEETLRVASSCGLEDGGAALLDRLLPLAREMRGDAPLAAPHRRGRRRDAAGARTTASRDRSCWCRSWPSIARWGCSGSATGRPRADRDTGVFREVDEQFLSILASQAAIAIKNAQLFEQVREAEKRLRETQSLLMQTEKLAALGEMSAKVAHEIRSPLSAVGGFARRIRRSLADDDPNAEHAALIVKEIRRLEEILTEQLEFARLSRPRLAMTNLAAVVRETLLLVREEAERKGVVILEEEAPDCRRCFSTGTGSSRSCSTSSRTRLGAVVRGNRILVRTERAGEICGSRSPTTASRCRGRSSTASSCRSPRPRPAGPGSAWPWPTRSSRSTAARSRSAPGEPGASPSSSASRSERTRTVAGCRSTAEGPGPEAGRLRPGGEGARCRDY